MTPIGPPTNLLEKVLIFRDSLEAPTNRLENMLIFCDSHAKTDIGLFLPVLVNFVANSRTIGVLFTGLNSVCVP